MTLIPKPTAAPSKLPVPAPRPLPTACVEASAADRAIQELSLSFGGFRYVCRVAGGGGWTSTPLVILGGSSQDRTSWTRHERWLTPSCPVVTVDLPGYGEADFLPARYGVDFLAAALRHLLDQLGVPQVNLVGACFGGAVGLRFAQHNPHLVARLMLVGMTTAIPADYAAAMERWDVMIRAGQTQDVARELADRFMSPPGTGVVRKHAAVSRLVYQQIAGQDAEQQRKSTEHNTRLMRHEWYRPGPAPAVPSLVVTGEHDTLATPAMGRAVAEVLPQAQFLTIRETDHLAPVERIAEFADLVLRFTTDQPLTGLNYATEPEEFRGARPSCAR
ncbi:alpha/beta fold hydrolase [Streptomyces sp. NPDC006879]|uniref:alpha/beta fold hydrolase n=1 Tax=Streptomyces sp. NPDC006879 TaxID=3364767 RepID=UPI00368D1D38